MLLTAAVADTGVAAHVIAIDTILQLQLLLSVCWWWSVLQFMLLLVCMLLLLKQSWSWCQNERSVCRLLQGLQRCLYHEDTKARLPVTDKGVQPGRGPDALSRSAVHSSGAIKCRGQVHSAFLLEGDSARTTCRSCCLNALP